MRRRLRLAAVLVTVTAAGCPALSGAVPSAGLATGFDPPEVILDGSDYGRLYPAFADVDGDGMTDLVVGIADWHSYDGGRLLVYRNQGTNALPAYATPTWLDAAVPSARIPDG
jgi:hypothetical protein